MHFEVSFVLLLRLHIARNSCIAHTHTCIQTEVFLGNSGIMDEKRAEKTDFYWESNSGSETGSPVH